MKPARDYDIRFGQDIVARDSGSWGRYVAISTPSAWKVVEPRLDHAPEGVGMNRWLDRTHLIEVSDSLPDGVDLVVGMGAGRALDHAKLVATRKGLPLVQVPTALSTGAIIHGFVADWDGRQIVGTLAEIDCQYVLVDYGIIKQAPLHLNTAGLGDVLCGYAGISEWRYSAAKGLAAPPDDAIVGPVLDHFNEIVEGFPPTLEDDGSLSDESVRLIMQAVQDRDDRMLNDKRAPSSDHSFSFGIELANDKYWTHGEACALGAVIVAWHTDQSPETLIGWLDHCRVRFRPSQMDISKEQLRGALEETINWLQRGGTPSNSVLVTEPIAGARFDECWSWLTNI